jgi:hypothetical protein
VGAFIAVQYPCEFFLNHKIQVSLALDLRSVTATLPTATAERHFHIINNKTVSLRPGKGKFGVIHMDIEDCTARGAHEVVMIANVGIKPRGTGTENRSVLGRRS